MARNAEIEREQRRRDRVDKELRELKAKLEKKGNEARGTMEKYLRDYDTLYQRTQKLTEDLEEQMYHNSQLALENGSIENDLKTKLEEINRLRQEKALQERKVD